MTTQPGWNFANVWEAVAERVPEDTALVHGERRLSWRQWDRDAAALADGLRGHGVRAGETVAVALYNAPETLVAYFAAFKLGAVPANTNYRYLTDELVHVWDDGDATAVVFDASMLDAVAAARPALPRVRVWVCLGAPGAAVPDWAVAYERLVREGDAAAVARHGHGADDIFLLYTGGTTGRPKGVMWRHDDFFAALHRKPYSSGAAAELLAAATGPRRPVSLPAAPMMHGGGMVVSWGALDGGGTVVTAVERSFVPDAIVDLITRHRVTTLGIIGDAFAVPLVAAIEARSTPPDLSSLRLVTSGGAMWSAAVKERMLAAAPRARLVDALGASEAINLARSVVSGDRNGSRTARFDLGENSRVLDDDGRDVAPGSGVVGRLAIGGPAALGYYKDPEATRARFVERDGARLTFTGDYATVAADGSVQFLGRGNLCINTGGEKVFPEEVEEVLKAHPGVRDAAVTGVADERFGQAVCAVVDCVPELGDAELVAAVRTRLAHYKAPRTIVRGAVPRLANGKIDYGTVGELAGLAVASRSA